MKKNNYVKPTMKVVEIKRQAPLICQSPPDPDPDDAYIPNMGYNELSSKK